MATSAYRLFRPMYPYVIVERLPRKVQVGGIVLTDDKNKPLHEGIVLRSWEPWTKRLGTSHTRQTQMKVVRMQSAFVPGDHVLFPHWAGVSDPSEESVLLIREHGLVQSDGGIIIGKLLPDVEANRREALEKIGARMQLSDEQMAKLINELDMEFILAPKRSKTMSGHSTEGFE
jgi:co-chaperonin GroES (HSP10)